MTGGFLSGILGGITSRPGISRIPGSVFASPAYHEGGDAAQTTVQGSSPSLIQEWGSRHE